MSARRLLNHENCPLPEGEGCFPTLATVSKRIEEPQDRTAVLRYPLLFRGSIHGENL
jgi:hypothetical protein